MSLSAEELSEVRSASGKNQQFWEVRPELIPKLIELWESGLTTAKMAAELSELSGEIITKNAVIGKVHRLNLLERVAPKPPKPDPREAVSSLEANDCRWPIGHPREQGFRFCRAPITQRERKPHSRGQPWPYCDNHYKQAKGNPRAVDETE